VQKFYIVNPVTDKKVGLLELPVFSFSWLSRLQLILSLASEHRMSIFVLSVLILLSGYEPILSLLVGSHGVVNDRRVGVSGIVG
jgi:hypothetical protein